MTLETPSFSHSFNPGTVHFGRGCIEDIGTTLTESGVENVLVVTGRNVGSNSAVMTPVSEALGDRLGDVFDETTPEKRIETAHDGVERLREVGAGAIVAVGGGSTLDTAKTMSVLHAKGTSQEESLEEFEKTGTISVPEDTNSLPPAYPVPTTLAGADLSVAAGTTLPPGENGEERPEHVFVDSTLMPEELFYDPALFETTPIDVLAGSAINGFDKGIEMLYSEFANPITDAAAVRGLRYLRSSLPVLKESDDPAVMDRTVMGIILAQYGVSVPGAYKINIVHAFGHAVRNTFGVQQGVAHAILVPHVLRLLFDEVDGRRDALADGLVLERDVDDTAEAVVDAVVEIRDGLDLPSRLRDVEGPSKDKLRDVAELTHEDHFFEHGPADFDPSLEAVEEVLHQAW